MPPGAAPQGPPPQEEQGPGVGGGNPAAPGQVNPKMEQALMSIRDIVKNVRQLSVSFPAASSELRQINDLVQRASQKIHASGPAPEPAAPPV